MRKIINIILIMLISSLSCYADVVDVYELTMSLHVPRVYDNTTSQGYRKYQTQRIKGYLYATYDDDDNVTLRIDSCYNKTHKVAGSYVKYQVTVDNDGTILYPRWTYIGSNKTGIFKTPSVAFYIDCFPSYAKGADEPDNSLLLTLAGTGITKKVKKTGGIYISKLKGTASGILGCGCMAYGHVSPTRQIGFCGPRDKEVRDVCAVFGTWSAKYVKSQACGSCITCR